MSSPSSCQSSLGSLVDYRPGNDLHEHPSHLGRGQTCFASWSDRLSSLGVLGAVVSAGAYLFVFDPVTSGLFVPCPFHALTGLYCPGCGTTRALHQLVHGNLSRAFGYNPLAILSLPFLLYALISFTSQGFTGRRLPSVFIPPGVLRGLVVVIVAFWILRNIPTYPFTLLAP